MNPENILYRYSKEISCKDKPSPRFGYTINIIFERKIVLFNTVNNKIMSSQLYLFV